MSSGSGACAGTMFALSDFATGRVAAWLNAAPMCSGENITELPSAFHVAVERSRVSMSQSYCSEPSIVRASPVWRAPPRQNSLSR